jgi:hypothetical protein
MTAPGGLWGGLHIEGTEKSAESVPRAGASEASSNDRLKDRRSLPLAVLIRTGKPPWETNAAHDCKDGAATESGNRRA